MAVRCRHEVGLGGLVRPRRSKHYAAVYRLTPPQTYSRGFNLPAAHMTSNAWV